MTDENTSLFPAFADKMRAEGLPEVVIKTFGHYYQQLVSGQSGLIPESAIRPVVELPDYETFSDDLEAAGAEALSRTVMIKLNGGLGTSMGLDKAKSLLVVKDGLSFLDIIARQATHGGVPLVLMNSFSTRDDSLAALTAYPELRGDIPLDFMQHKVPKVLASDFSAAQETEHPDLEWCPPGHGDLYTALVTTGTLDAMLNAGYETLFVSNADNLGADLDASLLGYFVSNRLPFMMEVADRSPADRKGGHLAQTADGQLVLRESAQCPDEDTETFQDITRHKYFNTNNLWVHLPTLKRLMIERDNVLGLSMIRNRKTLNPRDPQSPPVYQLETAMGSAIAVFEGAAAVRVPRGRFAPVKTTSDLLAIRSDDWVLSSDCRIVPAKDRVGDAALVQLDPAHYRLIDDMETRFPYGPPSLIGCQSLEVVGDVWFGRNVVCRGVVRLRNASEEQAYVADGSVCTGSIDLHAPNASPPGPVPLR